MSSRAPASELTLREPLAPRLRIVRHRLLRSAGFRFGVLYAALFSVSALALALFLWWSTAGLMERQIDDAINADSLGLAERYREGGMVGLLETLNQRLIGNLDRDAVYLLVDPAMRPVTGNLSRWPSGLAMDQEWIERPLEREGHRSLTRVHQFELASGFHLLIGRDVQARSEMRLLLTDALFWAAVIAVALGTVGAWAIRGLFGMALAEISVITGAVGAGDLTRRVRVSGRGDEFDHLAETINDMLDRIAQLMDGVRQVSNAIAHDLRTPIARARARLEDAATHATGEAGLRAALERAQADLDGITALFQGLLRIAEIEAGARRSAFAGFDAAPMLLDLADFYGALAEERDVVLEPMIAPGIEVFGDRDMVQQAVANLLDNAIKFSPPGTSVRLSAAREAGFAEIVVSDAGPGIPPEDRGRVTERFFRGETARSTPGSGLGLALVQAVATLHGGLLRLDDAAPGLAATLILPVGPGNSVSLPPLPLREGASTYDGIPPPTST